MPSLDFEKEKQEFRDFWNENHERLEQAKDTFVAIIKALLSDDFDISTVVGRVKDREESIKKFARKYQSDLEERAEEYSIRDQITDLIGLRVICLYEKDVTKIKEKLSSEFSLIDVTDKISVMESKEDSFGYKGLHVDLKLKDPRIKMQEYERYADLRFEVQIRTIIQDAWSVLDHKIKYKKSIPHHVKRKINTLAALFELADREFFNIKEETEEIAASAKKQTNSPSTTDLLDAFSFLAIVEQKFPDYRFIPYKVDGFVSEILSFGELTPKDFKKVVDREFDTVENYKKHLGRDRYSPHAINPYTELRYMLYNTDPNKFHRILYDKQRDKFNEWKSENTEV